jgi:hypothetical protein
MSTHWGLEGNIEGTCWEQRKNENNPPLSPAQNLNEKNQGTLSACFSLPIACMYFLLLLVTIFGLG